MLTSCTGVPTVEFCSTKKLSVHSTRHLPSEGPCTFSSRGIGAETQWTWFLLMMSFGVLCWKWDVCWLLWCGFCFNSSHGNSESKKLSHLVYATVCCQRSSFWLVWFNWWLCQCFVLWCVVSSSEPLDRSLPSFGNAALSMLFHFPI